MYGTIGPLLSQCTALSSAPLNYMYTITILNSCNNNGNNNLPGSSNSIPPPTTTTFPLIILQTISGVSITTVQSAAFQYTFVAILATYLNIPSSMIVFDSFTAGGSRSLYATAITESTEMIEESFEEIIQSTEVLETTSLLSSQSSETVAATAATTLATATTSTTTPIPTPSPVKSNRAQSNFPVKSDRAHTTANTPRPTSTSRPTFRPTISPTSPPITLRYIITTTPTAAPPLLVLLNNVVPVLTSQLSAVYPGIVMQIPRINTALPSSQVD